MDDLSIDDRFHLLLHKKIMNKTGSAKRRSKKYYKDQYKKNGIIPPPLLLVEKGIMDGRKCSGRPRVIDEQTQRRFIEMVKASCDPSSQGFIFITRRARTIKNYHYWLEEELGKKSVFLHFGDAPKGRISNFTWKKRTIRSRHRHVIPSNRFRCLP